MDTKSLPNFTGYEVGARLSKHNPLFYMDVIINLFHTFPSSDVSSGNLCSWWRHQMETFPALLALCAGNSPVPVNSPHKRPVTWSFDVFFDLCLNKRLSKQPWGWWFETLAWSLWRHRNVVTKRLRRSCWAAVISTKIVQINYSCQSKKWYLAYHHYKANGADGTHVLYISFVWVCL